MLLGSPPDTVHGWTLRRTGPSSLLIQVRRHILPPGAGIHPCCSGLQVQGTAISPTSAALPRTGGPFPGARKAVCCRPAAPAARQGLFYYIPRKLSTKIFKKGKKDNLLCLFDKESPHHRLEAVVSPL